MERPSLAMKVNDSSGTGISGLNRAQELTSVSSNTRTRNGRSERGDQVSLSNLSSALSASESNSPEQAAKLARLSAAVASGGYTVNAQTLSSNLIGSHMRA
jgi:anti-sigma28 factor (negative regulator of flagellin synthesis)